MSAKRFLVICIISLFVSGCSVKGPISYDPEYISKWGLSTKFESPVQKISLRIFIRTMDESHSEDQVDVDLRWVRGDRSGFIQIGCENEKGNLAVSIGPAAARIDNHWEYFSDTYRVSFYYIQPGSKKEDFFVDLGIPRPKKKNQFILEESILVGGVWHLTSLTTGDYWWAESKASRMKCFSYKR